MRALVTGTTGFSGSYLVRALTARGVDVHKVSHRVDAVDIRRLDLCSKASWLDVIEAVAPDFVFHVSGVAHAEDYGEYVRQNTLTAAALLDAQRETWLKGGPKAVLLVGSASEYGQVRTEDLPVGEDYPACPRSAYGATKLAQTHLALDAIRAGRRVVVARPSNLLGPGAPVFSAIGSFARQLREIELGRRPPILTVGHLSTSRDFLDVRDAVDTYVRLVLDTEASGVVHVAAGEHVPVRSVLDALIAEFGVDVTVDVDPHRFRAGDVPAFSASRALADQLLGHPPRTPLTQTLRDIVAHERRTVT